MPVDPREAWRTWAGAAADVVNGAIDLGKGLVPKEYSQFAPKQLVNVEQPKAAVDKGVRFAAPFLVPGPKASMAERLAAFGKLNLSELELAGKYLGHPNAVSKHHPDDMAAISKLLEQFNPVEHARKNWTQPRDSFLNWLYKDDELASSRHNVTKLYRQADARKHLNQDLNESRWLDMKRGPAPDISDLMSKLFGGQ
jgi:hypothetical protein